MRFATDTGGTFTDLIIEDDFGKLKMFKASTTPNDPVQGVLDALQKAAHSMNLRLPDLLSKGDTFIHGTTHAINAVITNKTAKTAFLTTKGHPDILLLREGGRTGPFNHTQAYPAPYIPRHLTYEIPERITADGNINQALDTEHVLKVIECLKEENVEAVSVCLLWAVLNPTHELEIGKLLKEHLPDIPFSLSHKVNPVIREYRRASATSIDASLKPLMSRYIGGLTKRLNSAGYDGRILILTSQGGMVDADTAAQIPIRLLNSGPSMAPIAGKYYGTVDQTSDTKRDIIVADTGGTTYDVSLVRGGIIPLTRDMWLGEPYLGHLTGFPSIEIISVGAGGGSVAWVDTGGLLHIGPESQGSQPGPACYKRGGNKATVTDAAVALGYLDPAYFLGGTMALDPTAADRILQENIATPLNISLAEAAAAVIKLATENMVQAIIDVCINQGVDPENSVLIGGGGAAGLNSIFIARRLGCPELVIPEVGATMSAAGATMAEISAEYREAYFACNTDFDTVHAAALINRLTGHCNTFIKQAADNVLSSTIEFSVEARYENQVWEIDVPLSDISFNNSAAVQSLTETFHQCHERIFAFKDTHSAIEIVNWAAKVSCKIQDKSVGRLEASTEIQGDRKTLRKTYFEAEGWVEATVYKFAVLPVGKVFEGPAIIETPFTTIVIDPPASFQRSTNGSIIINP